MYPQSPPASPRTNNATFAPPAETSRLAAAVDASSNRAGPGEKPYDVVLRRIRVKLDAFTNEFDLTHPSELLRERVERVVRGEIEAFNQQAVLNGSQPLKGDFQLLVNRMLNDILGLGFLTPLLADENIEEIIITGVDKIWVIREGGRKEPVPQQDLDHDRLVDQINRLVAATSRQVNLASPIMDGSLPDGARINVVIAPVAVPSPSVTIRRHRLIARTLDDLLRLGTLNVPSAEFLKAAVQARLGILVAGGTGTGKTNFLNVLAGLFERSERIAVIEDTHELDLPLPDVQYMITRRGNAEGAAPITQRELVSNALRMRPDRIVVGEVRGAEALDMIMASNTGHEGFVTTVHANSAPQALKRVLQLCELSEEGKNVRQETLAEWIALAFQVVVFLRFDRTTGLRYVEEIFEVEGRVEGEGVIVHQAVFKREQGELVRVPLPLSPALTDRMKLFGVDPQPFAPNAQVLRAPRR
jgi:pilus assembly protein CpaF